MDLPRADTSSFVVMQDGSTISFSDASGRIVDPMIVLSAALSGQVELRVEDFSLLLQRTTVERN